VKRVRKLLAICAAMAFGFGTAAHAAGDVPGLDREILVMVAHPPSHYRANGTFGGGYGDELAQSARARLARQIARRHGLTFVSDWPMPEIGVDCFVMAVPSAGSSRVAAELLSHDGDVSWAEPMQLYSGRAGTASHNDPLYLAQPAAAQWHVADLHRIATGRGTTIAVIDSGIDASHPDLAGQLLANMNFVAGHPLVAEQHGTAVAGIIAAKADNGIGIAGVAPGARLLGLRACWQVRPADAQSTVCDTLSLARALYFAAGKRPTVINLSLSGPDTRLLRSLVDLAIARGSTVVAAFDANLPNGGFPASVPGVIAVSDRFLAGSHRQVYIAPGQDVPTTEPGGRWFLVNGSSFAAAHVSGLFALMRERRPDASVVVAGYRNGTINACATVAQLSGTCDCSCAPYRIESAKLRR
jgi:subtilisin family serine protease